MVLGMRIWVELVFCGFGEPTVELDNLLAIARWVKQHNQRPLKLRVNTNGLGYLLNPGREIPEELKAAGIYMVSVSLNAENQKVYEEVCRPTINGSYEAVVNFIKSASSILQVEATAVRIPEVDLDRIKAVAKGLGVPFRIREYIPCFY